MKKVILSLIKYAVWGFLGVCFVIVLFQRIRGEVPTLFNHSVFIIVTDSMEGVYDVGDVILVKNVDPSEIKNGDVVTYYGEVGDFAGKVITHKVVKDPVEVNGVYHFQTQGVKRGASLDPEITEDQLVGKVLKKLKVVTWVYELVTNMYGFLFVIVIPIVGMMIVYMVQFFKNEENKIEGAVDEKKGENS